jgi:hypothetical protein
MVPCPRRQRRHLSVEQIDFVRLDLLKGSIAQLRHYVQPEQILISTLIQKPIARELLCDKGLLFRSLTRASPVLKEGDPISTGALRQ